MLTVLIVLLVVILALGARVGEQRRLLQMLALQNKHLGEFNAVLLTRCAAPDAELSNFIDTQAAVHFAVLAGYLGAILAQNVKEDVSRRADALADSLQYYRNHVAGEVANANH